MKTVVLVLFTVLFVLTGPLSGQDASSGSGGLGRPPTQTPTPVPTPLPGCSSFAANTNSWVGSGGLDLSFGTGGIVMTDVGGPTSSVDGVRELLVQPDGKIVTIGPVRNAAGQIDNIITRYLSSGALDTGNGTAEDPGFGDNDSANPGLRLGYTTISFIDGSGENPNGGVLEPNTGNILIIAFFNIKMARLTPTGQLDPTFGTGGKIEQVLPGDRFDAANATYDSNGKILVAGAEPNFKVARFNSNGSLDTAFGDGGSVTYNISGARRGRNSANILKTQWIDGSERILLAGSSSSGPSANPTYALMRFTSAGVVDTSFGTNGVVLTSFYGTGDIIRSIAIDSINRIVAAGYSVKCGGFYDASFARYSPNGTLDTTFSGDGKFSQDIYGGHNIAYSVAVQADNKIVASGYAVTVDSSRYDLSLVRLNENGTPDVLFGSGVLGPGIATIDFANTNDSGGSVAIQSNGLIVVGGSGGIGRASVVTRYLP